jgi:hypothetical protein
MREGRGSRTAERVALRRAAHQLLDQPRVLDDPLAPAILGADEREELLANPLWRLQSGQLVCGRASWVGTVPAECPEGGLDRIPPLSMTWTDSIERPRITRVLDHIFSHVRKPIALEQLVETIAELFQLPVTPVQTGRSERIDETASIESSLVIRSALIEVWREVNLLPPRQRIALLLGLRDETGSSVTSLLIHLRIVTFAQLAAAVKLSAASCPRSGPSYRCPTWRLPTGSTSAASRSST